MADSHNEWRHKRRLIIHNFVVIWVDDLTLGSAVEFHKPWLKRTFHPQDLVQEHKVQLSCHDQRPGMGIVSERSP